MTFAGVGVNWELSFVLVVEVPIYRRRQLAGFCPKERSISIVLSFVFSSRHGKVAEGTPQTSCGADSRIVKPMLHLTPQPAAPPTLVNLHLIQEHGPSSPQQLSVTNETLHQIEAQR